MIEIPDAAYEETQHRVVLDIVPDKGDMLRVRLDCSHSYLVVPGTEPTVGEQHSCAACLQRVINHCRAEQHS